MTDNNELKGLGGWLILVGIGVVIGPVRMVYDIITTYKPVFASGTWEGLTTVGANTYIPYFGPLLIVEIRFNLLMLVASVYLLYLFFTRHHFFPKLYIGISVTYLIFILLDAWAVSKLFHSTPMFNPDNTKELIQTLIGCLIWVPYMLVSERVKVTFVEQHA